LDARILNLPPAECTSEILSITLSLGIYQADWTNRIYIIVGRTTITTTTFFGGSQYW